MSEWPKHPDGRNKKIGEMTLDEERSALSRVKIKLQAEMDDPKSAFRRTCEAILNGSGISRSRH